MTHEVAVHKLRSFIKELENAGLIVPSAAEDINKAINTLASPLPVVRVEDTELQNNEEYAILFKNEWMDSGEWCYKTQWHNGLGFYDPDDDGSYIDISWVTYVIEQSIVDDMLGAKIPLEVN